MAMGGNGKKRRAVYYQTWVEGQGWVGGQGASGKGRGRGKFLGGGGSYELCQGKCKRVTVHRASKPDYGPDSQPKWLCCVCVPTRHQERITSHLNAYIAPRGK